MTIDLSVTSILLYWRLRILPECSVPCSGWGIGIVMIPCLPWFSPSLRRMLRACRLPSWFHALMGAIRYHLNPEIHMDWRVIGIFALFVIIGANLGATIAHSMTNRALQISLPVC